MDATGDIIAIHISSEGYRSEAGGRSHSMHAFAEVIAVKDGQRTDSQLARYKSTGFKHEEPPDSHASQTVIYAPITPEAAQAFRDFISLMVRLDQGRAPPFDYKSAFETMPEKGFFLDGKTADGRELRDLYTDRTYINCVDMLILACAVSGIDLNAIMADKIVNTSQDLKEAIHKEESLQLAADADGYAISMASDPNCPLVFADNINGLSQGPTPVFNRLAAFPEVIAKLVDDPYAFYAEQKELPPAIVLAAAQSGVGIPQTLKTSR